MSVRINVEEKTLLVNQVLTYNNTSNDTLKYIILNDWNNAFSSKSSALAKRFSDEFIRSFHLATEKERGAALNRKSHFNIGVIRLMLRRCPTPES
jgi:hypothetical protein